MEAKRGRGRPPTGKTVVKVRLTPAELEICLCHGATAQEGIQRILGTFTRTAPAEPTPEPTVRVRWFCSAKKCYTHPVNYGDFCSDCKSPRPT